MSDAHALKRFTLWALGSLGELSKRSGISRSVISEIESGKRNVSIAKLTRLADALDTDWK